MPYIVLTGSTGMLGSSVLAKLIEDGRNVNAVLRSFARSRAFLEDRYQIATQSGQLTFTEIPDMTETGAFDKVFLEASEVIHAATPLTTSNFWETMIKPASLVVDNVLKAAAASPVIKRLVVTGSIVSTFKVPDEVMSGKVISEVDWNSVTLEEATTRLPLAYSYSKTTSEKEAWAFMEKEKPSFDLIYLLAPNITGKNLQQGFRAEKDALGGVPQLYREAFDKEKAGFFFPYWLDVEDVAAIHVRALDASVPGNERYLFHSREPMLGDVVANLIRGEFPELGTRVPVGASEAQLPVNIVKTDIAKAEKVFGTEWKSMEITVRDMVHDILDAERDGRADAGNQ